VAQHSTARQPGVIRRFVPKLPLRQFIDLFWQYDRLIQGHSLERVLPTGRMHVIINLAEDETRIYNSETLPSGGASTAPYFAARPRSRS
jgi:hypothetical protein